ncbi:MAG: HEAT repeat domain-containing protein [bacterium]
MQTSRGTTTTPLHVVARVRTLMRQLVTLLKNTATYDANNEAFGKSIDMLYTGLKAFLEEHETLTLRIRKKEIAFGDQVVYVPIGRSDALIFPLYRDGIRRLTFSKDLTRDELTAFAATLVSGRETDPYESDLVTALWERDLANITYEAEDVYLERNEGDGINSLTEEIKAARERDNEPPGTHPADFLLDELGLASGAGASLREEIGALGEEDIERFRSQVLAEDDSVILERSSAICLEILETTDKEEVFRRTARFLGEVCDWLVSVQEFMPVCSIISDLRAIAQRTDIPDSNREAIAAEVRRRGTGEKLSEINAYMEDLSDAKMEELFCYLGQMDAAAIRPLCQMLADAETRRVRYMLARAISIVAKDSIESLLPFLRDNRWYVVRNIAMILGMIATAEALPYLDEVSRHPEARVRREAARALGRIRKPEGLHSLRILIGDDNKMIRLAAVSAAGVIGGHAAESLLKDAILGRDFETKATDEKRRFMEVYGTVCEEHVDFLTAVIDGAQGDASETTKACAAYGLATAGGRAAKKKLDAVLARGEGALRYAASEALAMICGRINDSECD